MSNIISTITVIFLLGAGASGLVGGGFDSQYETGERVVTSGMPDDQPVEAVRSFWRLSWRDNAAAQDLIGAPPQTYFDKRCPNPLPVVAVPSEVSDNWMRNSVLRLSARLVKHEIAGDTFQLISRAGDEAVVSVSFVDPGKSESGTIVQNFFLYRRGEKWKLFVTLPDRIFHNTSYADLKCKF